MFRDRKCLLRSVNVKQQSDAVSKHCHPHIYKHSYRLAAIILMSLIGAVSSSILSASARKTGRIALLGDSMTWIGGDSCQNKRGWSFFLRESGLADFIDVYARSGATWTNTTETNADTEFYSELLHPDNVVFNQALRLVRDVESDASHSPDCIILFAGANDAWFADRRPGIFNSTDTTLSMHYGCATIPSSVTSLSGSVALVLDLLSESLPSTSLLLVTPIQMSKVDETAIHCVSDIIEEAAVSRNRPVFRADIEVPITHTTESLSPTYTSDGVHTNEAGARRLADCLLDFISKILQTTTQ